MATAPERDQQLRLAAFNAVKALTAVRGELSSNDLKAGFEFDGERIPLVNPGRGIFKPQTMRYLLSIRTVYPKPARRCWRPAGRPYRPLQLRFSRPLSTSVVKGWGDFNCPKWGVSD